MINDQSANVISFHLIRFFSELCPFIKASFKVDVWHFNHYRHFLEYESKLVFAHAALNDVYCGLLKGKRVFKESDLYLHFKSHLLFPVIFYILSIVYFIF
jgi:hypothetical protein